MTRARKLLAHYEGTPLHLDMQSVLDKIAQQRNRVEVGAQFVVEIGGDAFFRSEYRPLPWKSIY